MKQFYYVDSWHEYGDKGFKFTISEFYSGPQMTFEMQFNSSVLYPNIILPNISNHFTMQQMQIADINQEWLFSFVNRYITEHNWIELTEYFWILEKQIIQISIDKPLTEEVGSYDYKDKYFLYPRDKFIASFFYDSDYSEFDTIDKLVLVSENVYTNPHTYILNFFEIRNELSWRYKFAIDNRKYQIRSGRSIYGFPNGKFFIFIDKQSFIIFITSKEGAFITSTTSDYQIDKIYTINNQIFWSTFQNVNKLYLYKLYEASDYYIKFVQAIQSDQRIIDVGINQSNEIVLFSGSNTIKASITPPFQN